MYEHLRNDFMMKLNLKYGQDQVNEIITMLDSVAINYEISHKSTSLAVVEDVIPNVVKIYIASKRLEGLSENSLSLYLRCLKIFFEMIGIAPEDVTTNDIRMFLASYRVQKKVSGRSLDKYRQIINSFFTWLTDEEYIQKNPCRTIKEIKYEVTPRRALSRFDLERLRRMCADERELAIVDVLYSTGCRVGELVNMKLSDIDFENRSVHIIGKGKKHHIVYLNENACLSLKSYLDIRKGESDYIFLACKRPYEQLSVRSVQHILKRYEKPLGCPLSPHILRHTMATLALKADMPITQVQKILNHSSVNTTQIYAETMMDDVCNSHHKFVV